MAKHPGWPIEITDRWKRMSREAIEESRRMIDRQKTRDIGDPNHPIHDGIFGYEISEFLAKQHK